jgi:Tfp pilus assembly protein PilE
MKELSQQERRKQVYMKSLSDAVAKSARNQKLADLFKAKHQQEHFANALNIHSTMSVMDLLKGDSMGTDQDEITRMETSGNLTKVMDDETADEFWQMIGDNEVFVETLNSNWRDLYNKLMVKFSD